MVHIFFRNVLFKQYIGSDIMSDFEYEKELIYKGDNFEIRGRLDDLIHFRLDDIPTLIEVKTIGNLKYVDKPKEHHLMQFNFYLGTIKVSRMNAYIIYIDRRNLKMKIFPIEKNDGYFRSVIRRAERLHGFLISNVVPPPESRIFKERNWECDYCIYKSLCRKIGEKKVL